MEIKEGNLKAVSIAAILFICFALLLNWYALRPNVNRGIVGDSFGLSNALFSGLAFAGIIITITLQRKELALQRIELRHTREELKRTATAQENAEKALNKQAENFNKSAELTALNALLVY